MVAHSNPEQPPPKKKLHGKYSKRVQVPATAKFGFFFVANTWQHLPHLLLEV